MKPGPEPQEGMGLRIRQAIHRYRIAKALQRQLDSANMKLDAALATLNPSEKNIYERNIKSIR